MLTSTVGYVLVT